MENNDTKLALMTAKRAMKIVFFIGLIAVTLMMINIYILLTNTTAIAGIQRRVELLEQVNIQNLKVKDTAKEKPSKPQNPAR